MVKTSMARLSKSERQEFLRLVDNVNSPTNGVRVIGRLRMRTFVDKHGEDVCKAFYDEYSAKLKKRNSK